MSGYFACVVNRKVVDNSGKGFLFTGMDDKLTENGAGYDALWLWFGLERASFLTIPRVLLHEMPDEWQGKMAALLREYDETFTEWPNDFEGCRVQLMHNGRYVKAPEWLTNYRHPDREAINRLRPKV